VDIRGEIVKIITGRTQRLLKNKLKRFQDGSFIIAGNALNGLSRDTDIDVYSIDKKVRNKLKGLGKVSSTKNADTYLLKSGVAFQVCKYNKKTLKDLILSFDYSHIQVGVKIIKGVVAEVYMTNDYIVARCVNNSQYLGSEYPLSSVIRAMKYSGYGELSKGKMIYSVLLAIRDVIKRGFRDYEDFKDQLDAVDLGLLPEDFEEFAGGKGDLLELFNLLKREA